MPQVNPIPLMSRRMVNQTLTNPSLLDRLIGSYYVAAGAGYDIERITPEQIQVIENPPPAFYDEGPLFFKEETVKVDGTTEAFDDLSSSPFGEMVYHATSIRRPIVDSTFIYNYEFKDYENLTRQTNINALPSYLLFDYNFDHPEALALRFAIKSYGGDFLNQTTNPGTFSYSDNQLNQIYVSYDIRVANEQGIPNNSEIFDQVETQEIKNYDINYFKFFTDQVTQKNPNFNEFINKNKNIFLSYTNDINNTSFLPFFVRLKTNSSGTSSEDAEGIKRILDNANAVPDIFSYIKNTSPTPLNFVIDKEIESLNVWDFFEWWSNFEMSSRVGSTADEIFLATEDKLRETGIQNYLNNRLEKLIMLGKLRKVLKRLLLGFEDVMKNKTDCPQLFLGYKITKHTNPNLPPVQSFYIDQAEFDFADNQLQYDRLYYYRISEIRLVIGSTHEYEFIVDESTAKINFRTRPSIKIVEILNELATHRAVAPPMYSPQVHITNERNRKNLVKFLLTDNIGHSVEHKEPYIPVLPSDNIYLQKIKDAGFVNDDNKARFYSRTRTGNFNVFKIDFKPSTYSDFSQGFLGTVGSNDEYIIDQERQTMFVDYIEYEKTYYYLFRSVNHHEDGGNPSYIYEAYLVRDADESILKYKAYPLYEKEQMFDVQTSCRKFLQIQPRNEQVIFNEDLDIVEVENTDNKGFLGVVDDTEKIWEFNSDLKYFKLRFVNKQTGKKFDLNIRYKLEKE